DDIVSTYNHHAIGSTYYLSDPNAEDLMQSLKNHPTKNYTKKSSFDKDGYFIPELLYTYGLVGHPATSPLRLKNNGVENFNILIKTNMMKKFANNVESNVQLIENTKRSLQKFYDAYVDKMKVLKRKYYSKIDSPEYDLLNYNDIDEIFINYGKVEDGVPFIFNLNQYEEILAKINDLLSDTEEIA